MTDIVDKSGAKGVEEHVSPLAQCQFSESLSIADAKPTGILQRLADLCFPYSVSKYPGKVEAFARLLGVPVSSSMTYSYRGGDTRLTIPVCLRAEKICADMIAALTAIASDVKAKRLEIERTNAPKHRGMFQVRVRDDTGIPRTGLARDGWRKNKSPPANF